MVCACGGTFHAHTTRHLLSPSFPAGPSDEFSQDSITCEAWYAACDTIDLQRCPAQTGFGPHLAACLAPCSNTTARANWEYKKRTTKFMLRRSLLGSTRYCCKRHLLLLLLGAVAALRCRA